LTNSSTPQDLSCTNALDDGSPFKQVLYREPLWQSVSHRHRHLDDSLKQWLLDPSSLTKKLITYSSGQLRVEVIDQRIKRARFSEYNALKIKHHHHVVVREVILYSRQTALVYARTIMPLSTLKGSLRKLYYLGNRPLGGALFADPSMRRGHLEIAPIGQNYLPEKIARTLSTPSTDPDQKKLNRDCWGRRSLFFLRHKPLLVCEIFLPVLIDR
jgi:chorismate--pyruvate lyase